MLQMKYRQIEYTL